MRFLFLLIMVVLPASAQNPVAGIPPRQLVPLEVMERARMATQVLMNETVRGNFKVVVDRMHPGFVEAIARPFGGPAKFKADMLKMMNQMGGNGIAIQAGITQAPDVAFEVDWGAQDVWENGQPLLDANGKPKQEFAYRQWMVYVPTVMDVFIKSENGELEKWRKTGFQIAISPKRIEDWTFIDGSTVTPIQLRKVFPFLPKDAGKLKFPEVGRQKILN